MSLALLTERKLKRIYKVLKGTLFTLTGKGNAWSGKYWDEHFYTDQIGDAQTISAQKSWLSAMHHYSSTENLIYRDFFNHGVATPFKNFLDIGSGAGHWIDFYRGIGAEQVTAIEVSEKCVAHLAEKYRDDPARPRLFCGTALEVIKNEDLGGDFDLVSSIGVFFHIVDDAELAECLNLIYEKMVPGGALEAWVRWCSTGTRSTLPGSKPSWPRHSRMRPR